MIVRKIMNGNCICDRLTDRQTDGQRNGEETKSPLRLAGWGLKILKCVSPLKISRSSTANRCFLKLNSECWEALLLFNHHKNTHKLHKHSYSKQTRRQTKSERAPPNVSKLVLFLFSHQKF
jgi:hypothetical protein